MVAEPRRMAAKAAARRMAWLLGEEPGGRVGHTVRGDRAVSPRTVVEVVTTGVLLQRLRPNQELPGTTTVLLDECHERHLDADTAMAFLLDVRAALRPDLRIVAASATTDADAWSRLLDDAPVVHAQGRLHPVAVTHAPPPHGIRPPHGTRVDPAFLDHVAATVRTALRTADGDVLCFLPGTGEIARVAGLLNGAGAEVLQLHGQAPATVQDAVLRGHDGTRRRVSSSPPPSPSPASPSPASASSSTPASPANPAPTTPADSAPSPPSGPPSPPPPNAPDAPDGKPPAPPTAAGTRSKEDTRRPRFPLPEIAVADLAAFALQAAAWGQPGAPASPSSTRPRQAPSPPPTTSSPPSAPSAPTAAPPTAATTLSRVGLHPRLARALLDGAPHTGTRRAADIVALLSEQPPRGHGDQGDTSLLCPVLAHVAS